MAGSWSLAFRSLQTNSCPPKIPDTYNKVLKTFITEPLPRHNPNRLKELCDHVLKSNHGKLAEGLTRKVVDKRFRVLKTMAQPGCSKTKNAHLVLLAKTPWGHTLVRQWTVLWLTGKMPIHAVRLWCTGLVTPLGKKSGTGVRPITLFETAFKLATGVTLDLNKPHIIKAVGSYQYGALMSSGADRMVYGLRALAHARPNLVFVATDVKKRLWHGATRTRAQGLA